MAATLRAAGPSFPNVPGGLQGAPEMRDESFETADAIAAERTICFYCCNCPVMRSCEHVESGRD